MYVQVKVNKSGRCHIISHLGESQGEIFAATLILGHVFHVVYKFCLHCALDKIHAWKLFFSGKIFAHGKIKSKRKSVEKRERKSTTLWRRAPRWRSDFKQRHRRHIEISHTLSWNRRFLLFVQVSAMIQKHEQSPGIVSLKAVCGFVVFPLSTFSGFFIFAAVSFFAFGFLPIFVLSSSTLHWAIEIKVTWLQWVTFPGKSWSNVIHAWRSRCPIGLQFQDTR